MDNGFFGEYQPYVFLALGLITLLFSVFWVSAKKDLKHTGIAVEGIVFKQGYDDKPSSDNLSSVKDKIIIRFLTETGQWITGKLEQDFGVFYTGQYRDGDVVEVYYKKDNPAEFYVNTKQSEFVGRFLFALVGLVFALIGGYNLFRVN